MVIRSFALLVVCSLLAIALVFWTVSDEPDNSSGHTSTQPTRMANQVNPDPPSKISSSWFQGNSASKGLDMSCAITVAVFDHETKEPVQAVGVSIVAIENQRPIASGVTDARGTVTLIYGECVDTVAVMIKTDPAGAYIPPAMQDRDSRDERNYPHRYRYRIDLSADDRKGRPILVERHVSRWGTIVGRLLDTANDPCPEGHVVLRPKIPIGKSERVIVRPSEDGSYSMGHLWPGVYLMEGWPPAFGGNRENPLSGSVLHEVVVSGGDSLTRDLFLRRQKSLADGFRFTGRVVDQNGDPLSGVLVTARVSTDDAQQPWRLVASIKTNEQGAFELGGVPQGTIVLTTATRRKIPAQQGRGEVELLKMAQPTQLQLEGENREVRVGDITLNIRKVWKAALEIKPYNAVTEVYKILDDEIPAWQREDRWPNDSERSIHRYGISPVVYSTVPGKANQMLVTQRIGHEHTSLTLLVRARSDRRPSESKSVRLTPDSLTATVSLEMGK